ncbi:MAG: RNA helicase [Peptococcaceae bacterium]|nr:RNA helicase [Peptococcaceae bacterium]
MVALLSNSPSCSQIIDSIQEHLPALYFTFSRGKTELLAEELSIEWDFLLPHEKKQVNSIISQAELLQPGLFGSRRQRLKEIITQGIAYHHAGLPPALKDLVERLYENRLIFVLFCTETFAVGVNFPAAATIFDSCRKWDGREFRGLINREFFQMAGRAGRRGFDPVGMVYLRIDKRFPEQTGFYNESLVEPVRGRLTISPNTVLSLLYWKTDNEINRLLDQNLAVYQNNKEGRRIRLELIEIKEALSGIGSVFCDQLDTAYCYMFRSNLKKEFRSLSRKNQRLRIGTKERKEEIRNLLKRPQKKCHHRPCSEAKRKINELTEKKLRLERRIRTLGNHSRDYERDFNGVWDLLENLSYVDGRELSARGIFALHLHVQEILVTEMVFNGLIRDGQPALVAAILAGVDFVPGRDDYVVPCPHDLREVETLCRSLIRSGMPETMCVWSSLPGALASAWYQGCTFEELQAMTNFQEGDIFSVIRREIDLLRQIERAAGKDIELVSQIEHIRLKLDRDEIAVPGI